ncbi:MAG: hypothetical protein ACSHXH_03605 [Marivita sp.]|uniref:hypothetical protein n=1 Tax=Marivita sp. TaxID=2003365 RepID=UPI003EF41216
MSRRFIAAVLAVSTTIAAFSAAPARAASEDDIARLLAGAATVFIIGKAIQNARDTDRDDRKSVIIQHRPKPQVYSHKPIPKVIQRDIRQSGRRGALPASCVRQIEGGHVNRVVIDRCLERNNIHTRSLPKACRMNVETRRGTARAYALPCLRQRGYTLARN